jgi:hypothetical protein
MRRTPSHRRVDAKARGYKLRVDAIAAAQPDTRSIANTLKPCFAEREDGGGNRLKR